MTRKEIFDKIKKLGLKESIKATYSTDYTHLSNPVLIEFLTDYFNKEKDKKRIKESKEKKNINSSTSASSSEYTDIKNTIIKLIDILRSSHILLPSEYDKIYETLVKH